MVYLYEFSSVGDHITVRREPAVFVYPHIPSIGFIVEVRTDILRYVQHFHVVDIDAAKRLVIRHAGKILKAFQILGNVYEAGKINGAGVGVGAVVGVAVGFTVGVAVGSGVGVAVGSAARQAFILFTVAVPQMPSTVSP